MGSSLNRWLSHRARARAEPRLIIIDVDHWDSFASFAAAVRRRGMSVVRIAPARTGKGAPAALLLDRLAFGPGGPVVGPDRPTDAALNELLAAPTVDVLGPEDVIEPLRESMNWSPHAVAARVPRDDQVRLLFDKLAMTRFAEDIPVPVPRSWEESPDGVFPLVVKGRTGAGGQAVRIARTPEELDRATQELTPTVPRGLFFQDLVPGELVNAGGVADRGRLLSGACYRALPPADNPLGPPVAIEIVRSPGVEASLTPLLEALSYTGIFCIDYIVQPDGSAALIDFNPRIFAAWLALQTAGVDVLGGYLSLLDLAPRPVHSDPPYGTRWDVRLLPTPGSVSWTQWLSQLRRSGSALRRVAPVTGMGFVVAMAARALRSATRDAATLRRGKG